MPSLVIGLYFAALGGLALLGLHRLKLAVWAWRAARSPGEGPAPEASALPRVLVQLPIYNEAFVVERLLRAVACMSYPKDRLSVQVLDDSTDGTAQLVRAQVEVLARQGLQITHVRRPERAGFKAGALAHGLTRAEARAAELVAIFDADFVPPVDFLERAVPALMGDPGCGLVQARWSHLNREASWLTRAQAVLLDGHFGVEHQARWSTGAFFNFNGTAGVWRRQAIEDAGGWSARTITEDLDLSYRAQLAGWRFAYLDGLRAPAELPDSWLAFRSQQARWTRGSVETARRLVPALLTTSGLSLHQRVEGLVHLTSNLAYVLMALLAALLPASVLIRDRLGWQVPGGQLLLSLLDVSMLTAGTLALALFYLVSMRLGARGSGRGLEGRLRDLLLALSLGAGMSVSNGLEALRGLVSSGSAFVRTPKRGDAAPERLRSTYRAPPGAGVATLELGFAVYFAWAIAVAVERQLWTSLPFLLLYLSGLLAMGAGSLRELLAALPRRIEAPASEPTGS